ncbi:hypothetical protein ACHRV6_07095 [Flavobacterium sp. FlaQc-51]|uniref:hypothetical protein n=1 Tax=Flavobacterium sp. FlaQc-51 TaxID=3374184 RepID=UPI0037565F20
MTKGDLYVSIDSQIKTTLHPDFIEFDSISGTTVSYLKMHKKIIGINLSESQVVPNGLKSSKLEQMSLVEFEDYVLYDPSIRIVVNTSYFVNKEQNL